MATKRTYKKPTMPKVTGEAEKVAKQMYSSLTAVGAPRATPTGYIMGTSMVFKMLIDQAEAQGADRDALKAQALAYIQGI